MKEQKAKACLLFTCSCIFRIAYALHVLFKNRYKHEQTLSKSAKRIFGRVACAKQHHCTLEIAGIAVVLPTDGRNRFQIRINKHRQASSSHGETVRFRKCSTLSLDRPQHSTQAAALRPVQLRSQDTINEN